MRLKAKLLHPDAKAPVRTTSGAAGWDLHAVEVEPLDDGTVRIRTGIAVQIPEGHVGLLFPRSSICRTGMRLSNSVGVIDSDYRGEVCAVFDVLRLRPAERTYSKGDRICQLVVVPLAAVDGVDVVDELDSTERGSAGFGSTGR